MFSRYKKSETQKAEPVAKSAAQPSAVKPSASAPAVSAPQAAVASKSLRRESIQAAQVVPQDKERRRKERLSDIKVEMHKRLLEDLNLGALETAGEKELRAEITEITAEFLADQGLVLNRDERLTLNQDLYDEVRGLGPLETLLKDDTVNDILVNGPQQIFVERNGKLMLSDNQCIL